MQNPQRRPAIPSAKRNCTMLPTCSIIQDGVVKNVIATTRLPCIGSYICLASKSSLCVQLPLIEIDTSTSPRNMSGSSSEPATVIHMDGDKAPAAAPAPPQASSSYATAPAPVPAPAPAPAATAGSTSSKAAGGLPFLLRRGADGFRRCLAVIDFLLRVAAFGPTLAAAISTGTADERLSVFTQFFQFHARFDDFPAFTFFLVGNAIAAGYLVLSLPFSAAAILRPKATGVRVFLLVCDVVVMAMLTAAGAAAAAIVYVAHSGNLRANWVPICMQFHGFCQRTSGAVVASFLAVLVFMVLIVMAACAIRRRR